MIFDLPLVIQLRIWKKLNTEEKRALSEANHPTCTLENCRKHLCENNHEIRLLLQITRPLNRPEHFCPICGILLLVHKYGGPLPFENQGALQNRLQYHYQPKKQQLMHIQDETTGNMR